MQDLTLALIQSSIHWEDVPANLDAFETKIMTIDQAVDLIILPEMFNTGFTMNATVQAEESDGRSMRWMAEMARKIDGVIGGSLIIREGKNFFNRFIWMNPDGSWQHYDKKHLFRMGDEHLHYDSGNTKLIAELKGWKVMPLICYDLRFPVWSKNTYEEKQFGYDLLIYVANWPAIRTVPWKTLLQARSIENMAYVAGVNRVGKDGRGYEYAGDSLLLSPDGTMIKNIGSGSESTVTASLNYEKLSSIREKIGVGNDWDRFTIH